MAKPRDSREFVRISTSLPDDPKLADIDSPHAGWLYVTAICWSDAQKTDGHVTPRTVERKAGVTPRWSGELIRVGLWHAPGHDCPACPQPAPGKVVIHDYLEHQRSKAEAVAAKESGRAAAEARWNAKPNAGRIPKRNAKPNAGRNAEVEVEEEVEKEKISPGGEISSEIALRPADERPDVERICEHLAAAIVANGSKRPRITAGWRTSARLLIDRDERTEQQIHTAIDWCQADEFWRANVLSMPKLREKYDQLRLDAQRRASTSNARQSPGDRALMLALEPTSEVS